MSTHSSGDHSSDTPLTLNDWLRQKRNDLRPEVRINGFTIQAEQSIDNDNFEDAIHYYSKAIELAPNDSHLFTNRSFCYEMIAKYDESLSDAQKAIDLSDHSVAVKEKDPKNTDKECAKYRNKLMFWRKGKALRALKRFQEAIDAMVLAKSLAIKCLFIDEEIRDIKVEVICDLGYDRSDVEAIADSLDSMDALITQLNENKRLMIASDGSDTSVDQLPANPFKYRGLYVNGLVADLEEQKLQELLESCGYIIRCKVYSNSEQSRAIITFLEEQSTREAIRTIRANKHLIRDKSLEDLVVRYRKGMSFEATDDPQSQFKGTEIGGECYKWRTTGCDDKECKALHIPICHHLDQQSVETEAVKRKRQAIVFDTTSETTDSPSNGVKKVISSERKVITFDLKDDDSDTNGLLTTSTPFNRRERPFSARNSRKSIRFDIDAPVEEEMSMPLSAIKMDGSSDRKVIRLNAKSESVDNELNSTPKVMSSDRKRIVFDLNDDTDTNDKSFTTMKPMHTCAPPLTPTPNNKAPTSYDDLFD